MCKYQFHGYRKSVKRVVCCLSRSDLEDTLLGKIKEASAIASTGGRGVASNVLNKS